MSSRPGFLWKHKYRHDATSPGRRQVMINKLGERTRQVADIVHRADASTRCDVFPRLRSFLTTLTQREHFEDSLDEEMQFHLDAQTEDWVGNGVPPAEATRRARMQFGSIEAVKDDCRRVRGLRTADELLSRIQWKTWYGVAWLLALLKQVWVELEPIRRVHEGRRRRRGSSELTRGFRFRAGVRWLAADVGGG